MKAPRTGKKALKLCDYAMTASAINALLEHHRLKPDFPYVGSSAEA
jgi:hypothetical protein